MDNSHNKYAIVTLILPTSSNVCLLKILTSNVTKNKKFTVIRTYSVLIKAFPTGIILQLKKKLKFYIKNLQVR